SPGGRQGGPAAPASPSEQVSSAARSSVPPGSELDTASLGLYPVDPLRSGSRSGGAGGIRSGHRRAGRAGQEVRRSDGGGLARAAVRREDRPLESSPRGR